MAEGVQIVWTPWRNHIELLQNREWLYSGPSPNEEGKADMRRKACDQISAWKLRGNLPHAVESTWLLTETVLADETPAEYMPIFALKAAYITAISRFVTGLLDSQQESKYKVSMYAKAQQIGLPALFVDLRHEATHGDMPSLRNLRSAAQRALMWLWDDYWKGLGEWKGRESNEDVNISDNGDTEPPEPDEHNYSHSGKRAMEKTKGQESAVSDSEIDVGSWKKWQGHWITKPIGTH